MPEGAWVAVRVFLGLFAGLGFSGGCLDGDTVIGLALGLGLVYGFTFWDPTADTAAALALS